MDNKCVLCGADLVWDQEQQKYSCSDECINLMAANDDGLPEPFRRHYRFLLRTVKKLRRDVSVLQIINQEIFDCYANIFGENPEPRQDDKAS